MSKQDTLWLRHFDKLRTGNPKALEDELVAQLKKLGHTFVKIKDETDLLANLKAQLEIHNNTQLTDSEFKKVLNHLNKGNVFERAKKAVPQI